MTLATRIGARHDLALQKSQARAPKRSGEADNPLTMTRLRCKRVGKRSCPHGNTLRSFLSSCLDRPGLTAITPRPRGAWGAGLFG
jgi:hypothetical protein